MNKRDLIDYRQGLATDDPFIFSSWLNGLRYANDMFEQIDQEIYFKHYHQRIELILKRSEVNIACLKDDPDVILGYSVVEPTILHWVFVKPAWRGIGLMRDLVPKDTKSVTHLTRVGLKIKPTNVVYNPFL